jgi:hypothetical protein
LTGFRYPFLGLPWLDVCRRVGRAFPLSASKRDTVGDILAVTLSGLFHYGK